MTVRSVFILLSITVLIGLQGCSQLFLSEGKFVHVEHNNEMIKDCKYISTVSGTSSFGLSENQKIEYAFNEVRNKAALLGANTVLIVSMDSMFKGTAVRGNAYDCPEENKNIPIGPHLIFSPGDSQ